jgi:hypothetical protein
MEPYNKPGSRPPSPLAGNLLPSRNRMAIANLLSDPPARRYIAVSGRIQPPDKMLNQASTKESGITSCHHDQSPPPFETHSPPYPPTRNTTRTRPSDMNEQKISQSPQSSERQCLNCGSTYASASNIHYNCNASTILAVVLDTSADFVLSRIVIFTISW